MRKQRGSAGGRVFSSSTIFGHMVIIHRKVRRISDDVIFEALLYGHEDGTWSRGCITSVAGFVLGLNPDLNTTIQNDRMLDVVRPIMNEFNLEKGSAPLSVAVRSSGKIHRIELGDWILKNPDKQFLFVKPDVFTTEYMDVPPEVVTQTEYQQLFDLIYSILPWEGDLYKLLTRDLTAGIIQAGWSKATNLKGTI